MITHKGSRSFEREPYFLSYMKLEAVVNVNVPFFTGAIVAFLVAVTNTEAPLSFVSFNAYQAKEAAIVHYFITDIGFGTQSGEFHFTIGITKCPDVGQVYSRTYSSTIVVSNFLFNAYAQRQQPYVLTFHFIACRSTFGVIIIRTMLIKRKPEYGTICTFSF